MYKPKKKLRKKASGKKKAKVTLEKIIGNSISSNSCISVHPETGDIAYPAGCVIVVYNPKKNKQTRFFLRGDKEHKTISCLDFSANGKFLVAGEAGHKPAVLVWDLDAGSIVSQMKSHQYGVSCVGFSRNQKYVVSVGYQHDGFLNVWDWKNSTLLARNKIATKIHSVSFSQDGTYFVTAGHRHVKFWQMGTDGSIKPSGGRRVGYNVIEGRNGILGEMRESTFYSVACGKGNAENNIFSVTDKGILCAFGTNRVIEKWVDLKIKEVIAVSVTQNYIACAGTDGIIRLFEPSTLSYLGTLPRPPPVAKLDQLNVSIVSAHDSRGGNADTIACKLTSDSSKLIAVYSDRSIYVWDVSDPKRFMKYRSAMSHSGCIWDIQVLPRTALGSECPLPEQTFITSSADGTIRFWDLGVTSTRSSQSQISVDGSLMRRRPKQMFKVLSINPDNPTMDFNPNELGVRSLSLSHDGRLLASGDRQGNLRIYNTKNFQMETFIEAHDAEILSLDFSGKADGSDCLIASGSRDRLIHVFDVNRNFDLVHTLDDHSSSITSVNFACTGTRLLSCSADKSIVFRSVNYPEGIISRYHHAVAPFGTIYGMAVDATQKYIVTAGQDKKLNIWSIQSGKTILSHKTEGDSEVIKVQLDPTGSFALTSCSDKYIRMYDFYSGSCIAKVRGHSEVVTGFKFTPDCKRFISVSGDGCIFVWKLSSALVKVAQERLSELSPRKKLARNDPALASWEKLNQNAIPKKDDQENERPKNEPVFQKPPTPPLSSRNTPTEKEHPHVKQDENENEQSNRENENENEKKTPNKWEKNKNENVPIKMFTEDGDLNSESENNSDVANKWAQHVQANKNFKIFSEHENSQQITQNDSRRIEFLEASMIENNPLSGKTPNKSKPNYKENHSDDEAEPRVNGNDITNIWDKRRPEQFVPPQVLSQSNVNSSPQNKEDDQEVEEIEEVEDTENEQDEDSSDQNNDNSGAAAETTEEDVVFSNEDDDAETEEPPEEEEYLDGADSPHQGEFEVSKYVEPKQISNEEEQESKEQNDQGDSETQDDQDQESKKVEDPRANDENEQNDTDKKEISNLEEPVESPSSPDFLSKNFDMSTPHTPGIKQSGVRTSISAKFKRTATFRPKDKDSEQNTGELTSVDSEEKSQRPNKQISNSLKQAIEKLKAERTVMRERRQQRKEQRKQEEYQKFKGEHQPNEAGRLKDYNSPHGQESSTKSDGDNDHNHDHVSQQTDVSNQNEKSDDYPQPMETDDAEEQKFDENENENENEKGNEKDDSVYDAETEDEDIQGEKDLPQDLNDPGMESSSPPKSTSPNKIKPKQLFPSDINEEEHNEANLENQQENNAKETSPPETNATEDQHHHHDAKHEEDIQKLKEAQKLAKSPTPPVPPARNSRVVSRLEELKHQSPPQQSSTHTEWEQESTESVPSLPPTSQSPMISNRSRTPRSTQDYRQVLGSLRESFENTMNVFDEVVRESQAEPDSQEMANILDDYQSFFESIQDRLGTAIGHSAAITGRSSNTQTSQSSMSVLSAQSVDSALERYSDILVSMVRNRLNQDTQ
eukprot:gb/GECH01000005.1/.p1 GENE.gb/GECH01000005.1/~~gb/GECH01000005.1/.p1  ORF type:complete len:1562 (+),score=403.91 gb/GECH01000005.1/:1-4686(+)